MSSTDEKAARYLTEGRVKVQHLAEGSALLHVMGSEPGEPYFVKFSNLTGWSCDCPARVPECAHVKAGMLVTTLRREAEPEEPVGLAEPVDIDSLLDL